MKTSSIQTRYGVAIALTALLMKSVVTAGCGGSTSSGASPDGGGLLDGTVDGTQGASGGASGGASSGASGGGASSGTSSGPLTGDGSLLPEVFTGGGGGASGASSGATGSTGCLAFGSGCSTNGDCCSGDCSAGRCTYPACTSDGLACTANGDCCSQSCVSGKCGALNTSCKTLGNGCTSNTQCCSAFCTGGTCQASSFCGQPGDSCAVGANCCTGVCNVPSGSTLGTCSASPPGGPANCGLTDGMLCGGSGADGGVVYKDGGLPNCGGGCCSRACAPFGPTGVLVCQPASGCHVVGDLCNADNDCCGGPGVAGAGQGNVTCIGATATAPGVCRNPISCKPDGDVCKLKTMSCNASCNCCAGNCETMDTCKQDNVGVPRCAPAQCVNTGGGCASSASCCNGAPCVPNPADGGTPRFVCSSMSCVAACGACTNNADCCPGSSCIIAPGASAGVCGPCGGGSSSGGSSTSSGGTTSSSGGSTSSSGGTTSSSGGSSSSSSGGTTCALYGQVCTTSSDCCNGVPCSGGHCVVF